MIFSNRIILLTKGGWLEFKLTVDGHAQAKNNLHKE